MVETVDRLVTTDTDGEVVTATRTPDMDRPGDPKPGWTVVTPDAVNSEGLEP